MQFNSFSDFIAMGGHGLYVWISYGFSLLSLLLLVVFSLRSNKLVRENIRKKLKREEKLKQAHQKQQNLENNPLETDL